MPLKNPGKSEQKVVLQQFKTEDELLLKLNFLNYHEKIFIKDISILSPDLVDAKQRKKNLKEAYDELKETKDVPASDLAALKHLLDDTTELIKKSEGRIEEISSCLGQIEIEKPFYQKQLDLLRNKKVQITETLKQSDDVKNATGEFWRQLEGPKLVDPSAPLVKKKVIEYSDDDEEKTTSCWGFIKSLI